MAIVSVVPRCIRNLPNDNACDQSRRFCAHWRRAGVVSRPRAAAAAHALVSRNRNPWRVYDILNIHGRERRVVAAIRTAHCRCLCCYLCGWRGRNGDGGDAFHAAGHSFWGCGMTAWLVVGLAGAFGAMSRRVVTPQTSAYAVGFRTGLRSAFSGQSLGLVRPRCCGWYRCDSDHQRTCVLASPLVSAERSRRSRHFAAELAGLMNNRNHRMLPRWTTLMVIGGGVAAYAGIVLGRAW